MPSAKVLEQNQAIVASLVERLKGANSGVVVTYSGINVEDDTALRRELRNAGVEYSVVKNTMLRRACAELGYEGLNSALEGSTAIATSADEIAPAKILKKYADKIECLDIKAGFADGSVLDKDGVLTLAAIPSKEELLAKFVGSIQSSLYNLAYGLQAIVDKGDSAEEAPAEAPVEAAPAEEAAPAAAPAEAAPAEEAAAPAEEAPAAE